MARSVVRGAGAAAQAAVAQPRIITNALADLFIGVSKRKGVV